MKGKYAGVGGFRIQAGPKILLTDEDKALKKAAARARRRVRDRKDRDARTLANTLTEHMKLSDDDPLT